MGWKIKRLEAHETFVVNFIVVEDIGSFPQREEYPIGELRSIRDKEISVPNRARVCLFFNIAWHGNSIDLDLYSTVRVLDIFCCRFCYLNT